MFIKVNPVNDLVLPPVLPELWTKNINRWSIKKLQLSWLGITLGLSLDNPADQLAIIEPGHLPQDGLICSSDLSYHSDLHHKPAVAAISPPLLSSLRRCCDLSALAAISPPLLRFLRRSCHLPAAAAISPWME